MVRKLLCGLVASAFLAMGCANSIKDEEVVCSFEPPPPQIVFSEVDFSNGFDPREECLHIPIDVPVIPPADFLTYANSLDTLEDIRFNDYLTRTFVPERLHRDVDIGAILIKRVLGVKPSVKEFGFFSSETYETVCPSGSSGCQQQQKIAILHTSLEEPIDLLGTVFHEEGHTLASPATSYSTFEERVLEEGKAYLVRLSGCIGLQIYDDEVMRKCVESTLGFTRSFLGEYGAVRMRDLDKTLKDKEKEAQSKNKSIYPYHKIGYAMVFALAAKNHGDLQVSYQILASADSHSLYDHLMDSSLTVREIVQLGADAIDRNYGSVMYSNMFENSFKRSYISNSYCDDFFLLKCEEVDIKDTVLFQDVYPTFIRNKF